MSRNIRITKEKLKAILELTPENAEELMASMDAKEFSLFCVSLQSFFKGIVLMPEIIEGRNRINVAVIPENDGSLSNEEYQEIKSRVEKAKKGNNLSPQQLKERIRPILDRKSPK
jgi:hypothetical protein